MFSVAKTNQHSENPKKYKKQKLRNKVWKATEKSRLKQVKRQRNGVGK